MKKKAVNFYFIFIMFFLFSDHVFGQVQDNSSKNRIHSLDLGIGLSRPSGIFETYNFQGNDWTFQKDIYKANLEFGYILEFQMKKNSPIFSFPKKNPLLKTGVIIASRSCVLRNQSGTLNLNYSQNNLILPIGILNSLKISDKKSKIYFEHGVGGYLNFLVAESIKLESANLHEYDLSLFSRSTMGVYLETGFSLISEKKKRHSLSLKVSKEINQAFYEGDTKYPFNLRNFNISVSYSLFQFIK